MDVTTTVWWAGAGIGLATLVSLGARVARAEATLSSAARTSREPPSSGSVEQARAFPRRAFVSLWLLRDLVFGAIAVIACLFAERVVVAAVAGALVITASLWMRARVAARPRPMQGRTWDVVGWLMPLSRLLKSWLRDRARRNGSPLEDSFVEGDGETRKEERKLDASGRELLAKIRAFGSRSVRDIMTPRVDVFSIPDDVDPRELLGIVDEARFSRVPVHHEDGEHIVGILYARELLGRPIGADFDLTEVLHAPTSVSPDAPVDEAFRDLRQAKVHIALVLDEMGTCEGLVTMEDLLEEVFGEIRDEDDPTEPGLVRDGRAILVPGRLPITELSAALNREITTEGEETTVGGVLMANAGTIPRVADQFNIDGLTFTVERREGNVIRRVRVEPEAG